MGDPGSVPLRSTSDRSAWRGSAARGAARAGLLGLALVLGAAGPGAPAAAQPADAPTAPAAAQPAEAPAAAPSAEAPAAAEPAEAPTLTRALFTTGIDVREPVDAVTELSNEVGQVYFFTELHDLAGQRVLHRWQWKGRVMAEVPFEVGGDRWRVWSSKKLDPSWLGAWIPRASLLSGI